MSIYAHIRPTNPPRAGTALLQIRGWEYENYELQFSIQRNQDDHYMRENHQWGSTLFWFEKSFEKSSEDNCLSCTVGPDILDPLLESPSSAMFYFCLRDTSGNEEGNPLKIFDGLMPSGASGEGVEDAQSTARTLDPVDIDTVEPDPEPAEDLTDQEQVTEPDEPAQLASASTVPTSTVMPAKKKPGPLILLAGLLILAVLAASAWWWFMHNKSTPTTTTAETDPVPLVTSAAVCSLEALESDSELAFVQSCIQSNPDSESLLKTIRLARDSGHCGVAQRLYANRAQAGDLLIAHAYAREYDTAHHQPSQCFTAPDDATAAYWYETILAYDPNDTEASQRLKELQP